MGRGGEPKKDGDSNTDRGQPGHKKHSERQIASQKWPHFTKGMAVVPLRWSLTGHEVPKARGGVITCSSSKGNALQRGSCDHKQWVLTVPGEAVKGRC